MPFVPGGEDAAAEAVVRPEIPPDVPGVRALLLAAFATPEEADLVEALRLDPSWLEGLSWVAVAPHGEVLAQALLTRNTVGGTPSLSLGPVAVLPELQGRGLGGLVIRAALGAAQARGERSAVVLGHPQYYPRFGFRPAADAGVTAPFEVPEGVLMVRALGGGPVPAGTVRYPAPFGV